MVAGQLAVPAWWVGVGGRVDFENFVHKEKGKGDCLSVVVFVFAVRREEDEKRRKRTEWSITDRVSQGSSSPTCSAWYAVF
jgi:hypothetical protein